MTQRMSVAQLLALPPAVDLPTAGRAWGLGRTKSHELARSGEFPCPVLRLGHTYRVTRADLLRSLGIEPETRPIIPGESTGIPASISNGNANAPADTGARAGQDGATSHAHGSPAA
jgi:hypothetical protein